MPKWQLSDSPPNSTLQDFDLKRETSDSKGCGGGTPLPPTAVDLVLSFVAVLLSVAFPEDGDALRGTRPAAELVHTARPHVCREMAVKRS